MFRLLVWDLPTRLFHWLFAFAFAAAYILGDEESALGWHSYFGYLIAGLIGFRLIWGFIGGRYSRFRDFPPNPAAAWRYLTGVPDGRDEHHPGHNPAGALAIYTLLALGLLTSLSGVALLGADKAVGPLAGMVPGAWAHTLEEIHEVCANAMLLIVLVHIAGVVLGSLRHRQNLPRAMVTGYKSSAAPIASTRPRVVPALAMLLLIALFTGLHDFTAGCGDNPAACEGGEAEEE